MWIHKKNSLRLILKISWNKTICGSSELDHHTILLDSWLSLDHAPLTIDIPICNEVIHLTKLVITPGSDQDKELFKDIISSFISLDSSNIDSIKCLNQIVNQLGSIIKQMWSKSAKRSKLSKHSKQWWTNLCSLALTNYRMPRSRDTWKTFKLLVKQAKRIFFNNKIQEIANKSRGS